MMVSIKLFPMIVMIQFLINEGYDEPMVYETVI